MKIKFIDKNNAELSNTEVLDAVAQVGGNIIGGTVRACSSILAAVFKVSGPALRTGLQHSGLAVKQISATGKTAFDELRTGLKEGAALARGEATIDDGVEAKPQKEPVS